MSISQPDPPLSPRLRSRGVELVADLWGGVAEEVFADFESLNPFGDRWRGHADAAGQLRHRHARVGLQLGQHTHVDGIQEPRSAVEGICTSWP